MLRRLLVAATFIGLATASFAFASDDSADCCRPAAACCKTGCAKCPTH
jgi:hypothetical protein